MSKHNLFSKKIQKKFLSINVLIESYFNSSKLFLLSLKKTKLSNNNKVILGIGTVIILSLSYLLIPTFYNKDIIQSKIKNQIFKKYNINLKFNKKIKYGLLPKPHFSASNLSILYNDKEIAVAKNFKIFFKINKFFVTSNLETKDLVFKKTDFNVYKDDLIFFRDLLKTEPNQNDIIFKESNIFFKNKDDEVLFINKIFNSKFYYDSNNLENSLVSKNEIFNIPYTLNIKNNKFNKVFSNQFTSKKMRLDIENKTDYDLKEKSGLVDISFISKNTSINYKLDDNVLNFSSDNIKNTFKGSVNFKPFYFYSIFNYDGLSLKNLSGENNILTDLIRSQLFFNNNLNANINLNVKDITNIDELNNLSLKIFVSEGKINLSDTSVNWREDLKITLNESFLNYFNDEINIIGTAVIDFRNYKNFYKSFQINKKNRKKLKEITLDFVYSLNQKKINFDNVKVDGVSNVQIERYINEINSDNDKKFNKITFKNFVNNFFSYYSG